MQRSAKRLRQHHPLFNKMETNGQQQCNASLMLPNCCFQVQKWRVEVCALEVTIRVPSVEFFHWVARFFKGKLKNNVAALSHFGLSPFHESIFKRFDFEQTFFGGLGFGCFQTCSHCVQCPSSRNGGTCQSAFLLLIHCSSCGTWVLLCVKRWWHLQTRSQQDKLEAEQTSVLDKTEGSRGQTEQAKAEGMMSVVSNFCISGRRSRSWWAFVNQDCGWVNQWRTADWTSHGKMELPTHKTLGIDSEWRADDWRLSKRPNNQKWQMSSLVWSDSAVVGWSVGLGFLLSMTTETFWLPQNPPTIQSSWPHNSARKEAQQNPNLELTAQMFVHQNVMQCLLQSSSTFSRRTFHARRQLWRQCTCASGSLWRACKAAHCRWSPVKWTRLRQGHEQRSQEQWKWIDKDVKQIWVWKLQRHVTSCAWRAHHLQRAARQQLSVGASAMKARWRHWMRNSPSTELKAWWVHECCWWCVWLTMSHQCDDLQLNRSIARGARHKGQSRLQSSCVRKQHDTLTQCTHSSTALIILTFRKWWSWEAMGHQSASPRMEMEAPISNPSLPQSVLCFGLNWPNLILSLLSCQFWCWIQLIT